MTLEEMDKMNKTLVEDNHLYPDQPGLERAETVASVVKAICLDATSERQKVNLRDLGRVKQIVDDYLDSCARTPLLPSKSGLCRALGYSRRAVWLFMRDNADTPTGEYLEKLFDAFSECYDTGALCGIIHPIYSIFVQKSQYGLRDNTPLDPPAVVDPLGTARTQAELEQQYMELASLGDADEK